VPLVIAVSQPNCCTGARAALSLPQTAVGFPSWFPQNEARAEALTANPPKGRAERSHLLNSVTRAIQWMEFEQVEVPPQWPACAAHH